jgi:mRNA interferase MazF
LVSEVRQGDVYWLDFGPAVGSTPAERHPCVVVQNDVFNQSAIATTVVCLITSNLRRANAPGNVLLPKGEANLRKPSVVNISQILTVDKSDLIERSGRLTAASVSDVSQGLHMLFERLRPADTSRQKQ